MTKMRRRVIWGTAGGVTVLMIALGVLGVASGTIWPGAVFAAGVEVRGVDLSDYQGDVDWSMLAEEDIDFAYIKATEGSSFVDSRFAENWADAEDTDLLIGAYHFLSYDSSGEAQAQHIIDTVPVDGDLPLAIDVEYYGLYYEDPPSRAEVTAILEPLLAELTEHYGRAPVIYATPDAYDRYIAEDYADNPIWIRSVTFPPSLGDGRDWTFWQYSPRGRLRGYAGDEEFIDLNAFVGSRAELDAFARG